LIRNRRLESYTDWLYTWKAETRLDSVSSLVLSAIDRLPKVGRAGLRYSSRRMLSSSVQESSVCPVETRGISNVGTGRKVVLAFLEGGGSSVLRAFVIFTSLLWNTSKRLLTTGPRLNSKGLFGFLYTTIVSLPKTGISKGVQTDVKLKIYAGIIARFFLPVKTPYKIKNGKFSR